MSSPSPSTARLTLSAVDSLANSGLYPTGMKRVTIDPSAQIPRLVFMSSASFSSVFDPLFLSALRGAQDRVADFGGAIAVLERRAVRRDLVLAGDRAQHAPVLQCEGVAPADQVAGRPPVAADPLDAERAAIGDPELIEALQVVRDRAGRAVDLEGRLVDAPAREARRLERA